MIQDDLGTREGLEPWIYHSPGYQLCGVYGSVEQALAESKIAPEVMLVGSHKPGRLDSETVIRLFQKTELQSAENCGLTPQEIRIVKLLSEGLSYQAVGDRFGITINTVRNYIRSVYDKLDVHSKAEAVGKALRLGII